MKLPFSLPWRAATGYTPVPEQKATGTLLTLTDARAHWTGRSYAALAREGFMKNPVAHRSVRLIAEAAASVSWLLYEGDREVADHPLLALMRQPNGRMAGPDFFEALHGHLLLSGNAYVEPLVVGGALRELYLLRPTASPSSRAATAGRRPTNIASAVLSAALLRRPRG